MPIPIVTVTHTVNKLVGLSAQLERDALFARRTALTRVGFNLRTAITEDIKEKADRPVPWISGAFRYQRPKNLERPVAVISVQDPSRVPYLKSLTSTGEHVQSKTTRALSDILQSGESLVPTRAVKRNAKGNVGKAKYSRLLHGPKAFVVRQGERAGVYRRKGRTVEKVLSPERVSRYKPLVDLDKLTRKAIDQYPRIFDQTYERNQQKSIQKALGG